MKLISSFIAAAMLLGHFVKKHALLFIMLSISTYLVFPFMEENIVANITNIDFIFFTLMSQGILLLFMFASQVVKIYELLTMCSSINEVLSDSSNIDDKEINDKSKSQSKDAKISIKEDFKDFASDTKSLMLHIDSLSEEELLSFRKKDIMYLSAIMRGAQNSFQNLIDKNKESDLKLEPLLKAIGYEKNDYVGFMFYVNYINEKLDKILHNQYIIIKHTTEDEDNTETENVLVPKDSVNEESLPNLVPTPEPTEDLKTTPVKKKKTLRKINTTSVITDNNSSDSDIDAKSDINVNNA